MNTCSECKFWDRFKPVIKCQNPVYGCCTNPKTINQIKCIDIRTEKDFGCINFE